MANNLKIPNGINPDHFPTHPHLEGLIRIEQEFDDGLEDMELAGMHDAPGYRKLKATHSALHAALAALPGGGVDWRDLYRFQTAMRYMDANATITRDKAYAMADEDIRRIEASPTPNPHEADRNDV